MSRRVVQVGKDVTIHLKRTLNEWVSGRSRNKQERVRARKFGRKKMSKKRIEKIGFFNESEYKAGLKRMMEYSLRE